MYLYGTCSVRYRKVTVYVCTYIYIYMLKPWMCPAYGAHICEGGGALYLAKKQRIVIRTQGHMLQDISNLLAGCCHDDLPFQDGRISKNQVTYC